MSIPARQSDSIHKAPDVRILLVEDHDIMREALHLLLENHQGLRVVGEASDCADAMAIIAREQPDIILLDLQLGEENGLDFLPALLSAAGQGRVIVLTASCNPQDYRRALSLGARGLVLKEQASSVLLKAIERVHTGETWIDPNLIAKVVAVASSDGGNGPGGTETFKITALTAREREIISLVVEGLKNHEIAERLFLSDRTVRHYLTSIFHKLEVADRSKLLIYAYRHGLHQSPS